MYNSFTSITTNNMLYDENVNKCTFLWLFIILKSKAQAHCISVNSKFCYQDDVNMVLKTKE
jgi:hypothetical protein